MTCIVGLVDKGHVYIGGDSAGADAWWNLTIRRDPKVFVSGPYVVGFTDSFRMGQVLRYQADLPEPPPDRDLMRHMVVDFIGSARKALNDAGFAKHENARETGGSFLVGVRGRLFRIDSDYQVGESARGFYAIGGGATYALGALAISKGRPKSRITQALQVAERFSAGVAGPFVVERAPAIPA